MLSRPSMKTRDSERYLGVITWTASSATSAARIVGRRIVHFLRISVAPRPARSNSPSDSAGFGGGGGGGATLGLMRRLLATNLPTDRKAITNDKPLWFL